MKQCNEILIYLSNVSDYKKTPVYFLFDVKTTAASKNDPFKTFSSFMDVVSDTRLSIRV